MTNKRYQKLFNMSVIEYHQVINSQKKIAT